MLHGHDLVALGQPKLGRRLLRRSFGRRTGLPSVHPLVTLGDGPFGRAFLRWRAIDFVTRIGASPGERDSIVSGDPRTPVEVEEIWTFVRPRGGAWLLSAIQQV